MSIEPNTLIFTTFTADGKAIVEVKKRGVAAQSERKNGPSSGEK